MAEQTKNFGFLIKDLSRLYISRFEQRAASIPLTLSQCRALLRIEENEGISQARLAELVSVDQMAMVRIIDFLEGDGLIERRADQDDRRVRRLFLTSKGRPAIKSVLHLAELARLETFVGVSERERLVFMKVLEKLHANLDTLLGDEAMAAEVSVAPVISLPRRKAR